ncbi:MAG: SRPBCC family protein [Rhodobacteraceae bacterium]|nr:SRPBCC family protein [Paracoccaceae bacterium]
MRFSTSEDIEAPIDHVFRSVTDFDGFERQALRRGAEVQRIDTMGKTGLGSEWQLRFPFRGKMRDVSARIVQYNAPNGFQAQTVSGGLEGLVVLELVSLSPRRTRMQVSIDLKPTTLAARLMISSLKFAKANLHRRYSNRVWQFAQDVQGKYQNAM